jgi:hypothetical protein
MIGEILAHPRPGLNIQILALWIQALTYRFGRIIRVSISATRALSDFIRSCIVCCAGTYESFERLALNNVIFFFATSHSNSSPGLPFLPNTTPSCWNTDHDFEISPTCSFPNYVVCRFQLCASLICHPPFLIYVLDCSRCVIRSGLPNISSYERRNK